MISRAVSTVLWFVLAALVAFAWWSVTVVGLLVVAAPVFGDHAPAWLPYLLFAVSVAVGPYVMLRLTARWPRFSRSLLAVYATQAGLSLVAGILGALGTPLVSTFMVFSARRLAFPQFLGHAATGFVEAALIGLAILAFAVPNGRRHRPVPPTDRLPQSV